MSQQPPEQSVTSGPPSPGFASASPATQVGSLSGTEASTQYNSGQQLDAPVAQQAPREQFAQAPAHGLQPTGTTQTSQSIPASQPMTQQQIPQQSYAQTDQPHQQVPQQQAPQQIPQQQVPQQLSQQQVPQQQAPQQIPQQQVPQQIPQQQAPQQLSQQPVQQSPQGTYAQSYQPQAFDQRQGSARQFDPQQAAASPAAVVQEARQPTQMGSTAFSQPQTVQPQLAQPGAIQSATARQPSTQLPSGQYAAPIQPTGASVPSLQSGVAATGQPRQAASSQFQAPPVQQAETISHQSGQMSSPAAIQPLSAQAVPQAMGTETQFAQQHSQAPLQQAMAPALDPWSAVAPQAGLGPGSIQANQPGQQRIVERPASPTGY